MGTLTIDIKEERFSTSSTSSYNLSILAGMDRFSYIVHDDKRRVLLQKHYTFSNNGTRSFEKQIKDIYLLDEHLRHKFNKITFGFINQFSTLIPNRLYRPGSFQNYFSNIADIEKNLFHFGMNDLPGIQGKNVFAISKNWHQQIRTLFPAAKIVQIQSPLIQMFSKLVIDDTKNIFINIHGKSMQLFYFDGKDLIFSNHFTYQTSRDFIYYVMLMYDQFNLKPDAVPVTLAGEITEEAEIYHLLYRYIRHLNIVQNTPQFNFGAAFREFPKHYSYDLYSMKLCE